MKRHKIISLLIFTILLSSACTNERDKTIDNKEEKINIGEYSLNFKDSGNGKHIIILESGLGMSSDTWAEIQVNCQRITA